MSLFASFTQQQIIMFGKRLMERDALRPYKENELISVDELLRIFSSPVTKNEMAEVKKIASSPIEQSTEEKIKIESHVQELVTKVDDLNQVEDEKTKLDRLQAKKLKKSDLEILAKQKYPGSFISGTLSDLTELVALGSNKYSKLQYKIQTGMVKEADFDSSMPISTLKKLASHLKIKQGKDIQEQISFFIERKEGGRGSKKAVKVEEPKPIVSAITILADNEE